MHNVQKKQSDGSFKTVRKFKEYKDAFYYCTEKFVSHEDGLHYSHSLKYVMHGYDRTRIWVMGCLKFKRNGIEYRIV